MKAIPPYKNSGLDVEERAKDLVSRMSLEEAMGQLQYDAPAIPRLDVEEYNWWNEFQVRLSYALAQEHHHYDAPLNL